MSKLKIAKTVSTLTQPPIITVPIFLIISVLLSFSEGVFDFNEFIALEAVSLVFASILPIAIILLWAKWIDTDHDISNRQDRFVPLIIGIISYFIGVLVCLYLNLNHFLTLLLLCYSVNTGVVLLITLRWKISVHTTGISGPIAALILLLGPVGALFGVIYPIVIWSRVLLKKHTLAQAICGGVQGFFLTVLEMYLFMHILNLPVYGMVGLLESCMYIMAIIATPVVLGILSYIKVNNSGAIFAVCEIILAAIFLILTSWNVFLIFLILTLTCIMVSFYAGPDFVWFRVLKSS